MGSPAEEAAYLAHLDRHWVSEASRPGLLVLLRRWGLARADQVMGFWTFLGDGITRPVSTLGLQVWGAPGTGKTRIVLSFLRSLGIRHVYLNCGGYRSVGDLHAHLAEELRRIALEVAGAADASDLPNELRSCRLRGGRHPRALDKLEAAVRVPLEYLAQHTTTVSSKVVVVIDNSQVLPRIAGPDGLQTLLALPQLLKRGGQLALVTVGRLKLADWRLGLGTPAAREPPAVTFQPYTQDECQALIAKELTKWAAATGVATPSGLDIQTVFVSGLMKFACEDLGCNLGVLLKVGKQVYLEWPKEAPAEGAAAIMAMLQRRVEQVVQQHIGLCDLNGLCEFPSKAAGEMPEVVSAMAAMQRMTKAEKRLILSSYLGARIDPKEDMQLFMAAATRKRKRQKVARRDDDEPAFILTPRPVPLRRLLAIYHCLARQRQLLGPQLFEHIGNLEEVGLLRFVGDRTVASGQDPKVLCRAELPLARACAADVGIDLAEYLCK